ncbi:MAG TPA: DUF2306 domain-containing protein [Gemmatimonadaceae bacterium]|nr:DUF2306 domain-containing protein [Gemmatimonadaceae bacterium]
MLVLIGILAAIGRGIFTADLTTRVDPVRSGILTSFGITDPFAPDRPALLQYIDGRFAAHRLLTLLHILAGAMLLLLAPLQFVTRGRGGYRRFHRWSGRALMGAAIVAAVPAFYFGVIIPTAGPAEAVAIATTTCFFLFAMGAAFTAIRRADVPRHREWMIRAFAAALAISTVRIVAVILDVALTPAGFRPLTIFVIAIWTGWIVTLGGAEVWIRSTRPREAARKSANSSLAIVASCPNTSRF